VDKETRKKVKRIEKAITRLKKELKNMELRPCHSDAEIQEKGEDLRTLKLEIYGLEKEANQYILYISGIRHGV
jgi:hypothetical protein